MATAYDPELLSTEPEADGAASSEELLLRRGAPQAWHLRHARKAAVAATALIGAAVLAAAAARPAAGKSAAEAMPSGVVRFQELKGTLSNGLNTSITPSELKGCCPMADGAFLSCCSQHGQCCGEGSTLSCCAGNKPDPNLKLCVGSQVTTYCPLDNECCDGRCASAGSVCCGDLICSPGNTCCENKYGANSCGSTHTECGGDIGGVTLNAPDWPNPATPKDWYDNSHNKTLFGETVYRKEKPPAAPLTPAQCADRCGLHGACCGAICCGKGATCCQNHFGQHTCGAVHAVCGGYFGGAPLHEDTYGYVEPSYGETVFRVRDSGGEVVEEK